LDFADAFDGDLAKYMRNYPVPERMDLCGRVFSRILNSTTGVKSALREMTERGILGWLIPEYVPLMVQIPYDVAHDLTVGEHSVRVAGFLEFLRETDDPRFSDDRRAWTSVQSPDVLFLAGLLHDIGKMWPDPKGHSEVGAEVGYRITIALGWDEERARKVEFLIRYHLLMAETSRLRDLRLEETIRDFTRIVDDQEKLSMLFLLTCADTSEVGVGIWSEMKGKFLAELFERASGILAAAEDLGGDQDAVFGFVPDLTKQRERVGKQLLKQNLPVEAVHEHTQRMTAQYLLTTPLEEIYLHMAMINRLRQTGVPTVDFRTESGSDFTELTIVAYDDPSPGLLAKIFGVMYALDITVHATHVFTRESSVRIAIDTLWVDFRGRPFSSGKKAEVQDTLRQILGGATSVDQLLERKKKPRKDQSIYGVRIDDTASDRYSLIEVRAPDETGVTYRLSRAMSRLGWNIVSARVSVWGSRVRAAFYIKDIEGRKIPQSEVPRLLAALPQIEYHPRATTHHGYNG
jgi:[protein-PII] uridylyltransferase